MNYQNVLSIKNLSFEINKQLIFKNFNLELKTGDYMGLIGPNGSGKTTLLRLITGFIKPTLGEIFLFDKPIEKFNNWDWIGYVPQKVSASGVYFPATCKEIIMSGHSNLEQSFDYQNIDYIIKVLNLKTIEYKLISEISGGQRQLVFIARSLVSSPKLLILDEPTVGIDFDNQQNFYDLLKDLKSKFDLTMLFVTHDLDMIKTQANKITTL